MSFPNNKYTLNINNVIKKYLFLFYVSIEMLYYIKKEL